MRIFVTGMTGFLGHELGQILLKKGHKLGTLARNVATSDRPIASNTESMIRGERQSGVSYYYGDLTDYLNIHDVLSSFKEIQCAINVSRRMDKPFLVGIHISQGCSLPSGEPLADVLSQITSADCLGVILSCISPENYACNLSVLQSTTLPFGFKLNGFITTQVDQGYEDSMKRHQGKNPLDFLGKREDLSPAGFLDWAKQFYEQGATILGGCCETGPEHIHALEPLKG